MTRKWRVALTVLCLLLTLGGTGLGARPTMATGAACDAPPPLDEAAASKILKHDRPFQPGNIDLFNSYQNEDWAAQTPPEFPKGPAPAEAEIRTELRDFLMLRFPCDQGQVLGGLAVFDNPLAVQKIPDPILRAALAGLTGTLGEPAIPFLLYQAPVSSVFFGVVMHYQDGLPPGTSATPYPMPDGTWVVVVDSRYRFVSFRALSALLFHELFHVETAAADDPREKTEVGVGQAEETVAISLESLVYMQMLLTDPSIASLPDPLTRGASNETVLARLNSGLPGSDRINLFVPGNTGTIDSVETMPIAQFADLYAELDYVGSDIDAWKALETRGNALLQTVLPALAEPGTAAPAEPDYDQATLRYIDENEGLLTPGQLVRVACILQLDGACGS